MYNYNNKEYLDSNIEWFWKYRQPYINRLPSDESRDEYKKRMQDKLNKNIATYEGSYDIEYCQYCYMPLAKDSVGARHGHCGYSCP